MAMRNAVVQLVLSKYTPAAPGGVVSGNGSLSKIVPVPVARIIWYDSLSATLSVVLVWPTTKSMRPLLLKSPTANEAFGCAARYSNGVAKANVVEPPAVWFCNTWTRFC